MRSNPVLRAASTLVLVVTAFAADGGAARHDGRIRYIIETDAGGDPDDEQSFVRFLLYANEWDIEGIIANRAHARDGENLNPERTGLGILRRMLRAYGQCYPNLARHDPRYPSPERLLEITVPGYEDTEAGVDLIIQAVDRADPRPVWFSNWGTDHGSAPSCLKRALDRVRRERGQAGYARFKEKLRLSSADAFGEHTASLAPPWSVLGGHLPAGNGGQTLVSPLFRFDCPAPAGSIWSGTRGLAMARSARSIPPTPPIGKRKETR